MENGHSYILLHLWLVNVLLKVLIQKLHECSMLLTLSNIGLVKELDRLRTVVGQRVTSFWSMACHTS